MNKVYILSEKESINSDYFKVIGVVTSFENANKFLMNNSNSTIKPRKWEVTSLDDPELLNRIAKAKIGEENV